MSHSAFAVLDPGQLRRIEGTHRGFLYQHLFGVAALLLAPANGVLSVLIEHDEDVELRMGYRIGVLEKLHLEAGGNDRRRLAAILLKQILLAGRTKKASRARKTFRRARQEFKDDSTLMRIIRYDFARALFECGHFEGVESITGPLILEYYEALRLAPADVFAKNIPEIAAKLNWDTPTDANNAKRLADTLEMHGAAVSHLGRPSPLARMHAHKFFMMVHAVTSAVRVGQDMVDELLALHDVKAAMDILDGNLLPVVKHYRLFEWVVPVRAQRAVVLAYAGRSDEAIDELQRLRRFRMDNRQLEEFQNQCRLVDRIVGLSLPAAQPDDRLLDEVDNE